MLRILIAALSVSVMPLTAADKPVTWSGWFSDFQCASAHAAAGIFAATNPECSKTCIEKKGAAPVFVSEQAKAVFTVKGYPGLIDDLGYHVQVEGSVDEAAKTIKIAKVTRLGYDGAACSRRRQKTVEK